MLSRHSEGEEGAERAGAPPDALLFVAMATSAGSSTDWATEEMSRRPKEEFYREPKE